MRDDPVYGQVPIEHLELPLGPEEDWDDVVRDGRRGGLGGSEKAEVQHVGIVQQEVALSGSTVEADEYALQNSLYSGTCGAIAEEVRFYLHRAQCGRKLGEEGAEWARILCAAQDETDSEEEGIPFISGVADESRTGQHMESV
mmetsp:Transcript_31686/g.94821  ORF Transcript_31686/g.94821 Transcript_31686/m.94821 type:complete len:143 (+) Transcript_31686:895-1323(+)